MPLCRTQSRRAEARLFISRMGRAGDQPPSCSAKLSRGGPRLCRMHELRGGVFQDGAQRSRGRIAGRILPFSDRLAAVMQFAGRDPSATDSALCSFAPPHVFSSFTPERGR
jgi:hypothetical protein